MRTCKEKGCNRRECSRGWCSSHYRRWRAGVPMDTPIRPIDIDGCSVPGCDMPHHSKYFCRNHYNKEYPTIKPARWSMLRQKYGITESDYQRVFEFQGGVCAVCKLPPREGKVLFIDHDHNCCGPRRACRQCLRGLLCAKCNTGLYFHESSDWRASADEYISNPPWRG